MIDCCSHYPDEFLKLLRAWARKSQRDIERKRQGEAGGKIYGAQQCKALEVLCNLGAPERLAGKATEREKESKEPSPKETLTVVFFCCSRHTQIQSEPPLCMVSKLDYVVANAFFAADKKVRLFISGESL